MIPLEGVSLLKQATPLPPPPIGYLTPPNGVAPSALLHRVPNPFAVVGAISGAIFLIGALGGNKFKDDQAEKVRKLGARYTGREISNTGQSQGVLYTITWSYAASPVNSSFEASLSGFIGAITEIGEPFDGQDGFWYAWITDASGRNRNRLWGSVVPKPSLKEIKRVDGEPETPTKEKEPVLSGWQPNPDGSFSYNQPPQYKEPSPALVGGALAGVGLGGFVPTVPSRTKDPEKKTPVKPSLPDIPPQPNKPVVPNKTPDPVKKKEDDKPPFTPTKDKDISKINQDLSLIIGSLAAMKIPIDNINTNTQPEALKNAAKEGSCQALNSPSCTQNLKDDIKNPINQNIDAKTAALGANQAAQDVVLGTIATEQQVQKGVLATIAAKATDIFDLIGRLWNNSLVDKAMQYITMITVIHNAAMLSRGIGDTLGSALDSGLQALGLQIKDKDGNAQGVTQIIGKSFEDLIKGIIGADNYTALTNTWLQANRVYQAGINLLSNIQNILDSTTAVAELTSNRVATLMNSLRNAGVVREDAYRSQTPNTTRFNAFMNKLENLEQGTSNVAAITGNIAATQQAVNELKSNRTEFENAINNKNTTEEASKTEKREESVFKIGDFSIVRPPEQI